MVGIDNATKVWCRAIGFLCALFLLSSGCTKNPTIPPPAPPADTTSNVFTWTFDTVGVQGTLVDVAIVNDSFAIAVGDFHLRDSTGQLDLHAYNTAVWNGIRWSPVRVYYNHVAGALHSVFALSEHDVWLDIWARWDGQAFQQVTIDSMFYGVYIYRMWGDSTVLYAVGSNGFIARFAGGAWQKIQSGTSLDIVDIWGAVNPSTGKTEILCVASKLGENDLISIIKIDGGAATLLSTIPIPYPLSTVWFVPGEHYYVAGSNMYQKQLLTESTWKMVASDVTQYYIYSIRGSSSNDVYAGGSWGEFLHYNGARWQSFRDVTSLNSLYYNPIAVRGRLVMALGYNGVQAIVLRGVRQ